MTLNQFAAEKRLAVFDDLESGREPREGNYDPILLKEARAKQPPQMGATQYTPSEIIFEFIFPDRQSSATVLVITIPSPERIVFLPVPSWVVENIWQGDIEGTYHFETEALKLVAAFGEELAIHANRKWFDRQPAKRRE